MGAKFTVYGTGFTGAEFKERDTCRALYETWSIKTEFRGSMSVWANFGERGF